MAIKNYTTKVPAHRSIAEIQDALVHHGARGMLYKYEHGTGRIEALQFLLPVKDQNVTFSLPVNWQKFQRVLRVQDVRHWDDEEYVYRVAQHPRLGHGAACPVRDGDCGDAAGVPTLCYGCEGTDAV